MGFSLGLGGAPASSQSEWDLWDQSAFDRLSNQGIAPASESSSLWGQDWDYWGDLLGGQGGSGYKAPQMAQAQAPKLQSSSDVLGSLMGQVGRAPAPQAGGAPWQQRYVTSLMDMG